MCGRFTFAASSYDLASIFDLEDVPELLPRYNIAPTQIVASVRVDPESSAREIAQLKWGLVPSWAKDPSIGNKLINARGETINEKVSFKRAFRSRRCLILADGFYEWRQTGRRKQPFHIRMKDGAPFVFAGLWERWTRGEEPIESCTIITTEPNDLVQPIHGRMPVILHADDWPAWIDRANEDTESLAALLKPYPSEPMVARPVTKAVNNPRNDGPECIEPVPRDDLFT